MFWKKKKKIIQNKIFGYHDPLKIHGTPKLCTVMYWNYCFWSPSRISQIKLRRPSLKTSLTKYSIHWYLMPEQKLLVFYTHKEQLSFSARPIFDFQILKKINFFTRTCSRGRVKHMYIPSIYNFGRGNVICSCNHCNFFFKKLDMQGSKNVKGFCDFYDKP